MDFGGSYGESSLDNAVSMTGIKQSQEHSIRVLKSVYKSGAEASQVSPQLHCMGVRCLTKKRKH